MTTSASDRLRKAGVKLLWVLALTWIFVVVLLTFLQRKLMYLPEKADSLPVRQSAFLRQLYPHATDVQLLSQQEIIRGWWLREQEGETRDRPLVLFFHGNAGNRAGRIPWYQMHRVMNCDVLAIDYHGYGDSGGSPSQPALEADGEAAWKLATGKLRYAPDQIIVMGVSLGGAVAVHVASAACEQQTPPAGLITVATFSSMADVAAAHYPFAPVRSILKDDWSSVERIPGIRVPILHLHGDQDTVVGDEFGRRLFEAAPAESTDGIAKRWVTLEGCGHNDMLIGATELIRDELIRFAGTVAVSPSGR